MIGENVKMLREQIDKKKGMITSKRVLSEEAEKEISFSAGGKIRGLQMTDIGWSRPLYLHIEDHMRRWH